MGPFVALPEYTTPYPDVVTDGLRDIYGEYNRAFATAVDANME